MKKNTCCFFGHDRIRKNKTAEIIKRLEHEVEALMEQGVTTFISGGAPGFEQVAASHIIAKKEMGQAVRLVFTLPCRDYESLWTPAQKKRYHDLLSKADEIIYMAKEYTSDCLAKRDRYMMEQSDYCICDWLRPFGKSARTMTYAEQMGVAVIRIMANP